MFLTTADNRCMIANRRLALSCEDGPAKSERLDGTIINPSNHHQFHNHQIQIAPDQFLVSLLIL